MVEDNMKVKDSPKELIEKTWKRPKRFTVENLFKDQALQRIGDIKQSNFEQPKTNLDKLQQK